MAWKLRLLGGMAAATIWLAFSVTSPAAAGLRFAVIDSRMAPQGNLSDGWTADWQLAANRPVPGPPKGLTEIQEAEYYIGFTAGAAAVCGDTRKAFEVRQIFSRSPHFKTGWSKTSSADGFKGCGKTGKFLDEVIENKDDWQMYLGITYPGD